MVFCPRHFNIPANAVPTDPIIPLAERFFGGGNLSHRGFPENQAGPRDLAYGLLALGGSAEFFNSTELRFPLIGENINGVLFHDMGNVYSSIGQIGFRVTQHDSSDFDYMVHAIGFGVRYRTPIGPGIRLDLSYSLNPPRFNGFSGTYSDLVNCTASRHLYVSGPADQPLPILFLHRAGLLMCNAPFRLFFLCVTDFLACPSAVAQASACAFCHAEPGSRAQTEVCVEAAFLPLLLASLAHAVVVDRIAVTVGNQVITETEILRDIALTAFLNGEAPSYTLENNRKAADREVEQKLIRKEMQLGNYPEATDDHAAELLRQQYRQERRRTAGIGTSTWRPTALP